MEKISSQEYSSGLPQEGMSKEALEGFEKAQDLIEKARQKRAEGLRANKKEKKPKNIETNTHFRQARVLEEQSEAISREAHTIRKEVAEKKKQEDNRKYDAGIRELRQKREEDSRLQKLKEVQAYLRGEKRKKGIDAVDLHEEDDRDTERISTHEPEIISSPVQPSQAFEQEITEIGLSSPEELKTYLAGVTDIAELNQNKETREEAIQSILSLKEKATEEKKLDQVRRFQSLLEEQQDALAVVEDRIKAVSGTKNSDSGFWEKIFGKRHDRNNKKNDAA